ncbi:hypothetical protein [Primorskyibacter sp. S87]|uniref:hypothetical protein n=1 Tax=Primorskyibacter sp. S87 TaxID=3415126 RepID=UPI003C7DB1EE
MRDLHDCFSDDIRDGLLEALDPFSGLGLPINASVWWCGDWMLEVQAQVCGLTILSERVAGVDSAASVLSDLLDRNADYLARLYQMQGGPTATTGQNPYRPTAHRSPSSQPLYLVETVRP